MRLTKTPMMTVIAAVLVVTVTAGCTAGASAPLTPAPSAASGSETDPTGPAGSASAASPSVDSTPTAAPVSQARITATPADGARGASVLEPILLRAAGGTLGKVAVTNPGGKEVTGKLSADRTTWTSGEPLGYGRSYRIVATAKDTAGLATTNSSSFTTVKPVGVIFPSFEPSPQQKQVGVGQPIAVIFDSPPPDKAAAERALTVSTVPQQVGGWYWVDDRTVHYRPKQYWKAGTKITVKAKVYGVALGGGMFGETDRTLNLTIGPAKIATIDDATKQMTVSIDGKVVRQFPVSMGRDDSITVNGDVISFVTPSGIYVAQEKYPVKQMSSASYGLPTGYELGYDSAIPLAVRLSNSGIFAHSAPWSVADQGIRNVSHGCINMPPDAAQWFYDTFSYGDIVQVKGTSTQLAPDDGYGDWNIGWNQWVQGSALT